MPSRRHPTRNKKSPPAVARQARPCVVGRRRRKGPEQTHRASSHRQLRGESRIPLAGRRAHGEAPLLCIEGPEPDRKARRKFGGQALRFSESMSAEKCRATASLARREPELTEQVRFFPAKSTVATLPVD